MSITHSPGYESDTTFVETLIVSFGTNFSTKNGSFDISDFNSTNISNAAEFEAVAINLAISIFIYLTPVLVFLGVSGNYLSVHVFYTSKLKYQSTSQYLSALAISDSLFLLQLLPPWFSALKINGLFHRQGFCQTFVYVSYVTSCFSAWLVIAFTVERFVAVEYPLQRNVFCTVTRARYIILALLIAAALVNCPILIFAGPGDEQCNIYRDQLIHAARFNWVDTTVSFAIPTTLIVLLNYRITIRVSILEQDRIRLVKQEQSEGQPGQQGQPAQPGQPAQLCALPVRRLVYPRSQQRVTRMLLIVSSVYVILNLPAYVMRILSYVYDMNSSEYGSIWLVMQQVSTFLFNSNYGINFFLYCLSGQNFRRALVQSVACCACFARSAAPSHGIASNRGRAPSLTTSAASNTEPTTHCAISSVAPDPQLPQRSDYIFRWKANKPRERSSSLRNDTIEMIELPPRHGSARPSAQCTQCAAEGAGGM